jgi:hypothetical protein
VTFKIEMISREDGTSIKLIGRLRAELLPELRLKIETGVHRVALEMEELTLVDVEVVRFFGACERQGVQLRNCPAYIREWIARERERSA